MRKRKQWCIRQGADRSQTMSISPFQKKRHFSLSRHRGEGEAHGTVTGQLPHTRPREHLGGGVHISIQAKKVTLKMAIGARWLLLVSV